MMAFSTDDDRYEAVRRRNAQAEGAFYYGVATTGVFCRPTCAARLAKRENVTFFETPDAAAKAGFRPCKRCRPLDGSSETKRRERILQACRIVEQAEDRPPNLAALAAAVGVSPYHFHRLFKQETGMTPKAYAQAFRAGRLQRELRTSGSVTAAIYESGFNSSSRFYAQSDAALGMAPSAWRKGGAGETIEFTLSQSSLGQVLIASSSRGLCAILFGDGAASLEDDLRRRFPKAQLKRDDSKLAKLATLAVATIERPSHGIDLPLDLKGTAFQQAVWRELRKIPPGSTRSYGEIAEAIGAPSAVRAVAGACARNNLAVAVPCHRVVARDGSSSGYRWGKERKIALLQRERQSKS